jgi:predicted nucleic acid-binding protein
MKKIVLDTNVLISFLTDRNVAQQEKAAAIFSRVAASQTEILCQQEVISEFVYVMNSVYRVSKSEISNMLVDFSEMPGVDLVSGFDLTLVTKLWPARISDYSDAVIAALCKKTSGSAVATFDQKFSKELIAIGLPVLGDGVSLTT